jgi:hypothetical protein
MFSYAVLGPAHYLTQISWLHDRRYFANSSALLPAMFAIACVLTVAVWVPAFLRPWTGALLLSLAVCLALLATAPGKPLALAAAGIGGAMLVWVVMRFPGAALFVSVMLPTVLHIFVFTASFMTVGALRTRTPTAYLSVLLLLAGGSSFLLPSSAPAVSATLPHLHGLAFFEPVVDYLSRAAVGSSTSAQAFGFLSFAYTYHYLNWFSKASVIRWNQMPRLRLGAIVVAYLLALALYAYSFVAGFLVILLLSYLHVLLELPLNLRTFAALAWRRMPA